MINCGVPTLWSSGLNLRQHVAQRGHRFYRCHIEFVLQGYREPPPPKMRLRPARFVMTAPSSKTSSRACLRPLRADLTSGREFIRETLKSIRIAPDGDRARQCPICRQVLGKLTPQHLVVHGLTLREGYKRFPELGFTKRARLLIQPSPQGLLQTGEVYGLRRYMVRTARNWALPLIMRA